MNAAQRRERILTRLTGASEPMSASLLAGELGVSRQIVVGDVDIKQRLCLLAKRQSSKSNWKTNRL